MPPPGSLHSVQVAGSLALPPTVLPSLATSTLSAMAASTFPSWSSGLALPPTTTAFTWPQTVPWMTPPTNVDGPSHHLLGQVPAPNGLILSPMTEPIGPKLVHRIRSGQFVEMRELLPDNMALHQNLEAMHGHLPLHSMSGSVRPRFREVASPLTWITCFLTYLAVSTADDCTRDQLCYARLLLQEASRHGGSGWMEYDRVFRKQAAIDSSLPWNSLQPGLHASSILSQRSSSEGMFCALCKGPDHLAAQCALAYLQQPAVPPMVATTSGVRTRTHSQARRQETMPRICISWNRGACSYPGCTFRHICATCTEPHMAKNCPLTPEGSDYKRVARLLRYRARQPHTTSS